MKDQADSLAAEPKPTVTVVGGGNFGTVLANIIARNGHPTRLWMRDEAQVADCLRDRENRRYLPGHALHDLIEPTLDLEAAAAASRVVLMSVPSASFREATMELAPYVSEDDILISATKGLEADGESDFRLMSQILGEATPSRRIGVLSGPNLAEEIADGHYTGTVIASHDAELCTTVQNLLNSETLRVYASDDIYGVELGGALKNIYAIVCGMAGGMAVGQNTIGMLITRSLAEMSRFAMALGANPFTFLGLAGVGDLVVTCTSPLSRNYQLGYRLGSGMSLDEALADLGKLAEGVNTLRVVRNKSLALDVYMPLAAGLYRILFESADIGRVIGELMTGGDAVDVEFVHPQT